VTNKSYVLERCKTDAKAILKEKKIKIPIEVQLKKAVDQL